MKNIRTGLGRLAAAPHILWTVLFIVAPLIFVIYYTFTDYEGAFTFNNIFALQDHVETFALSIEFTTVVV